MKPAFAWLLLFVVAAGTVHALLGPWWVAACWLVLASVLAPSRLAAILLATSLPFHILFLGFLLPGTWSVGPWAIGTMSLTTAASASIRLAAIVAIPHALTGRTHPARLLEALRLPPRATAAMGALLLAMQDLADDWHHIRIGQRAYGQTSWRRGLSAMVARAVVRGEQRLDAIRMARLPVRPSFAPITAFAALAAATRMATVAIPNVAPTFVVVFLAGWWGGAWIGFASGAAAMLATDLLLSGPNPTGLVNIPAMGIVGAIGAMARPVFRGTAARSAGLAAMGVLVTLGFSVIADSTEWLLLPELRNTPGAWALRVAFGLVFNVPAAIANAVLFAAIIPTATRGLEALSTQHQQAASS